ncbi:MAG: cobalt-precorrin-5B (C(1))-methyltransferase [Deltaproteobacteria bacterium]|nr:cobalt-precorrin-5B (C(1))-methyltransferase [Deltaproteobacteria bacterium]
MRKTDSKLRRGFTTGVCAAAGAKAAARSIFMGLKGLPRGRKARVPVTLPNGAMLEIPVRLIEVRGNRAVATVVKDAGDDPDVTNGAEFVTEVLFLRENRQRAHVSVRGGEGVGVVTRPGLKVPVGRPAINPVPRSMISMAIREAAREAGIRPSVVVTVSVPRGKELAKKTMNGRLGIVGGISILGTTGIVEPMSLAAFTNSISCGVDVALAAGLDEVVFSTGRSSERVVERALKLPEVAYVLTGDHMGYALRDAGGRKGLRRAIVAGQFGKFTKLAAGHFETHCSDSSVEFGFLAGLCKELGADAGLIKGVEEANTAMEVFFMLREAGLGTVLERVCSLARANSMRAAGGRLEVRCVLVGYDNDVACVSG